VVRETAGVLAFHHTRPSYPVHIVVVPRRHIESLSDLRDEDAALIVELMLVIRDIAAEVTSQCGAARVTTNTGVYQDSKHLHFHVLGSDPL
jgi:histidine triad (HIT) family protein